MSRLTLLVVERQVQRSVEADGQPRKHLARRSSEDGVEEVSGTSGSQLCDQNFAGF